MPLLTQMTPGADSNTVSIFANVYHDPVAQTLEFGARVYSTPEAARELALGRPIRENLTYLGPVPIASVINNDFISTGMAADAERFRLVQQELAALRADESSADGGDDSYGSDGAAPIGEQSAPALPAPSPDTTVL